MGSTFKIALVGIGNMAQAEAVVATREQNVVEVPITMENIAVGDFVRVKGTNIIFKIAEISDYNGSPNNIVSEDTGIDGPLKYPRDDLEPIAGNWWTSPIRRIYSPEAKRYLEALEETRLEMMAEINNNKTCRARGHKPCNCEMANYF